MKRKLYFLRHAIALDRENWQGKDDELRPLVEQGVIETQRLARHLKKVGLVVDQIVTSPLVRAHDTAKIVAEALNIPIVADDGLKPGCDMPALKKLLEKYDVKNLVLVGHEPDFGGMITGVVRGGRIKMKKGALACVELEDGRKPDGVLRWLLPPDLLID